MSPKVYHQSALTLDVGEHTPSGKDVKILFHRFADLPFGNGQFTRSPLFTYGSAPSGITIYPGGYNQDRYPEGEGFLALSLTVRLGAVQPYPSLQVSILDKHQNVIFTKDFWTSPVWHRICARSIILDPSSNILDDNGTLAIVVAPKNENGLGVASPSRFIPRNHVSDMTKMSSNAHVLRGVPIPFRNPDVRFEVSCADAQTGYGNGATSSPVAFDAHRFILEAFAPKLASLFGSQDEEVATATITDVEPAIFRHLLDYVYGGEVAGEELTAHAKDIIDAADKYGMINLKSEAEAAYIKSTKITLDNVLGMLRYADALNLPRLKEAVKENKDDWAGEGS